MDLEEAVEYALSEDDSPMIASRTPEQASATARPPKELVLSERTVDNHVRNILKKLNLSSRSEVTVWVEAQRS